jgi:tetratricopeptide (TPR) repeat protein
LLSTSSFVACTWLGALSAYAAPTVWTKARDPEADRRRAIAAQAEVLILKAQLVRRGDAQGPAQSAAYLRDARRLLEEAGAQRSQDPEIRLRLAEVLYELAMPTAVPPKDAGDLTARSVTLLEGLVTATTPAPIRAWAWYLLAQSYTRLGRTDDEIRAYGEALKLQPDAHRRSVMLANRAEAYMLQGDLTRAIDGYRSALAAISSLEMFQYGVTTLWGLAVALDRAGDLEQGIAAITLARSYDQGDRLINDSTSWFYVPPYDEAWYRALGHWASARRAELRAVRAEEYGRAVAYWEEYLARAPPSDRFVPLAKARLRMCEKEREAGRKKVDPPGRGPPGPSTARAPE